MGAERLMALPSLVGFELEPGIWRVWPCYSHKGAMWGWKGRVL